MERKLLQSQGVEKSFVARNNVVVQELKVQGMGAGGWCWEVACFGRYPVVVWCSRQKCGTMAEGELRGRRTHEVLRRQWLGP
jgi:hypothetical protein